MASSEVSLSSHCVQWPRAASLKLAVVGEFTPWKRTDATSRDLGIPWQGSVFQKFRIGQTDGKCGRISQGLWCAPVHCNLAEVDV